MLRQQCWRNIFIEILIPHRQTIIIMCNIHDPEKGQNHPLRCVFAVKIFKFHPLMTFFDNHPWNSLSSSLSLCLFKYKTQVNVHCVSWEFYKGINCDNRWKLLHEPTIVLKFSFRVIFMAIVCETRIKLNDAHP